MTTEPRWRRFAYVAVEDAACRTAIARALASIEWRVEERSTGFHLLQDLCDIIAGDRDRVGPGLIVVDAEARGCSGLTIARGLRDLGVQIPVVVIASSRSLSLEPGESITIVDAAHAADAVIRIARPRRRNDSGPRSGFHSPS